MNDNVSIVQVSMHNAAVFKGSNFLLEGAYFFLKAGVDSFNFCIFSSHLEVIDTCGRNAIKVVTGVMPHVKTGI